MPVDLMGVKKSVSLQPAAMDPHTEIAVQSAPLFWQVQVQERLSADRVV